MNLARILKERAAVHPERAAIVDRVDGRDRVVSYGELWRRVSAGGRLLAGAGLGRGMTVLVFHPVRIELYEFLLAAFHQGVRVMLADPSAGQGFISLCCGRLAPDGFFGSWKAQWLRWMVPELRGVKRSLRTGPWFPGAKGWRCEGEAAAMVEVEDEEAALITFTSGSTGAPKAAVRTHGFLMEQGRVLAKSLDFREGEVDLVTLPVFVLANLAAGLTSVIAATDLARPGFPDGEAVRAQCDRMKVTRCAASPAFFEGLLKGGLPGLEKIYTGGAPVFPDLLRRLGEALPEARVEAVYGSTEAEPIAHAEMDEAAAAVTREGGGLLAGVPVEEIAVRVIRDRWGSVVNDLEEAEVGEIVVSGGHVLRGYLGGVGDEETKIRAGGEVWHRTGDAGRMDEKGRLWLLGRCAEKMEGGIYPFGVECALREVFPEVRTAALMWEGKRTLVVGGKVEEGMGEVAERFGMERVVGVERVPMDRRHNAKVDYGELRRLLGASERRKR